MVFSPLKIERTLHSFSFPFLLSTAHSSGGLQKRKERYVCCVRYGKYLSQVFFWGEEDVTRHVLSGEEKNRHSESIFLLPSSEWFLSATSSLVSAPDPPEWFSTHHRNHSHLSFLNRPPPPSVYPHPFAIRPSYGGSNFNIYQQKNPHIDSP